MLGNMNDCFLLSDAQTRSISPENPTGAKGLGGSCPLADGSARNAARDLGEGWKVNPYILIEPGETATLADIAGEGVLRHIWMTPNKRWRDYILRFYWDGQTEPTVECPMGDFFAMGWNEYAQLSSLAICVNPGSAFNCYWPMPFSTGCRVTCENIGPERATLYFQIDYTLESVPVDAGRFCAQFHRSNPLEYMRPHTILEGVSGRGRYVGTYIAWGVNNRGWWGEGEIKFFIDGDREFPTICGTGTEDYFCGSYNFEDPATHDRYASFCTPYSGLHQVIAPDALYRSQFRFGLYRWHIADPVFFQNDLRVTIQALGWRDGGRYLPLRDDISSVAFWYQSLPSGKLTPLPCRDDLEVI